VNPLVKSSSQHPIGHNDVQLSDSGRASEQVPVDRSKAVAIDGAIRHRDDDMAIGAWSGFSEDQLTQFVFVRTMFRASPFEVTKDRGQEARLIDELARAAIVGSPRLQHPQSQTLEGVHILLIEAEVVVELDHLRNKAWPDEKRRLEAAGHDGAAGNTKKDFPLLR
jgi:hypothetical protein